MPTSTSKHPPPDVLFRQEPNRTATSLTANQVDKIASTIKSVATSLPITHEQNFDFDCEYNMIDVPWSGLYIQTSSDFPNVLP